MNSQIPALSGAGVTPDSRRLGVKNIRIPKKQSSADTSTVIASPTEWVPKPVKIDTFPDQATGQGGPPQTIDNVSHLLNANGISARYNVIKKRTEISIPGLRGVIDNGDSVAIAHVKSLMAMHGMGNGDARSILDAIANQNAYNPVADWILGTPWDGVDRVQDLCDTIETVPDYPLELKEAIIRCWLLSAVAAALMPSGFSTRLVLTLQGPQSIGKTRWCLSLVPDPLLRSSVVKTDHHFDGGNKDNIITAMRHWLVELGELESSFRKDQERLKGILTRDRDVVRIPYAAADSEWPRRTVFMASANGSDFLSDPSGSTRWGVIAVQSINYEHGINMQQLYAQLAVDFQAGKPWWFDKEQERQLESWNERHQTTSIVRDAVAGVIDLAGDDTHSRRKMTASDVLQAAGIDHPTQAQARECGAILRSKFGPPRKSSGIYRWELPIRPLGADADDQSLPGVATSPKSKFD
jgi:putative DNA primase/helicase